MYTVTSDPARNRLYITLVGHLEGPERQAAVKALMAEVAKLAPGFDLVSDISALHPTNEEGFRDLLRVKATLKLRGVGHIIRVTRIPLSRIQFERISEAAGYESECVGTREEADRRLDELKAGVQAAP